MSEMVDRVAVAIIGKPFSEVSRNDRRNALITARAVIEAMREPTEAMEDAGGKAALSEGAHDCEVEMSDVYRAMIDEALK